MSKLNLLSERAAVKISEYITTQHEWVKKQEETLADTILGLDVSPYDLRQIVSGIKTGNETLEYLKVYFEQFVGVSYSVYCKNKPEIVNVETPADKIMEAIQELIDKK